MLLGGARGGGAGEGGREPGACGDSVHSIPVPSGERRLPTTYCPTEQ